MRTPLIACAVAMLAACGARTPTPAPGSGEDARVTVAVPPLEQDDAPAPGVVRYGSQLYPAARARVEGAEEPGECASDADCARAGCSQEVCVAARRAGDVITTCEILPVFSTLDSCGCHEGACVWTLKEPVLRAFPVPSTSPPADPPG